MPPSPEAPLRRKLIALPMAALACAALPLRAETPADKGRIILTVTGLDPDRIADGRATFDEAALAALGEVTFSTASIWTEGKHDYTGVPLLRLAASLGLSGDDRVMLLALNDYQVEFPLAEALPEAPILAYRMDGKPMSVRDKGPIWLVYPYDADPDRFQTVTTFARSVWQLDRIEVSR